MYLNVSECQSPASCPNFPQIEVAYDLRAFKQFQFLPLWAMRWAFFARKFDNSVESIQLKVGHLVHTV